MTAPASTRTNQPRCAYCGKLENRCAGPAFDRDNQDGYYLWIDALNSTGQIAGLTDWHGGGSIVGRSEKTVSANQQYLYRINDGHLYTHVSESSESQAYVSDERGDKLIRDNMRITYNVDRAGSVIGTIGNETWKYHVWKTYGNVIEASGTVTITGNPFVIY